MLALLVATLKIQSPILATDWELAFERNHGIWVSRADGRGLARVATRGQNPRWSHDGKKLAYYRDGYVHVLSFAPLNDRLAARARYRPDSFFDCCYLDWDPLTSVILCASISGQGIELIGGDGDPILRQSHWQTYCPRWSPSGRELAFARSGDIWLAHRDLSQLSTQSVEYYDDANRLAPLAVFNDGESGASARTPFWVDELEWTRDEKRLVFHFQRQGGSGISEIGYLDLQKASDQDWGTWSGFGYTEHWILGKDHMVFSPRICPDGKTLSYVSNLDGNEDLYVCSWDGLQKRRVLRNVENPDWRPVSRSR